MRDQPFRVQLDLVDTFIYTTCIFLSDSDIAVTTYSVVRIRIVNLSCGSIGGYRCRVEDDTDIRKVFVVEPRVALTETPRINDDLGSFEESNVSS